MKKILTILAITILVAGCGDDKPEIKAPSFIKPHLHHLYKSVPACFKEKGIANNKYDCSLRVKTVPATGRYKGHPTYVYNGGVVGGVTIGRCGSSSEIILPVIGETFSESSLQHEVCHAYDICGPCRTGHPSEYGQCCPSWPYLRSLVDSTRVETTCVMDIIDDNVVYVTVLDSSVSIQSMNTEWIKDLLKELDYEK